MIWSINKIRAFLVFLVATTLLYISCTKEDETPSPDEKTVSLSFTDMMINNKNSVTVADLLLQIKEKDKEGFKVSSLKSSDVKVLEVSGKAPDYKVVIKKAGVVTITMVLKKSGYKDVKVSGKVTIKGLSFTFGPLVTSNGTISTAELLSAVNGTGKAGYALKSISSLDAKYGSVNGTAPGLSIVLTKTEGNFTADLLLEKSGQLDVWIRGAKFSYVSGKVPAPGDIKWKPTALSKLWSSGGSFTASEILGNVLGSKAGYKVKDITNLSDATLATVSGDVIKFKNKAGNLTADITLSHATRSDVKLSSATFEIGYVPVNLSFSPSKLSVKYGSSLTEPTLRGKYNGSGAGAVSYTSNNTAVATVDSGTGKVTVKSKGLVKITATQAKTLTHAAGVASYDLEVSDKTAVNLVFDRSNLTVQLGSSSISEPTLSGHYTGSGAGLISYTSSNSTVAEVDSSGKLTVKALGTSVITVTQAATATHTGGSASYTLTVTKSDAPTDVKWKDTALSKVWSSGGSFSSNEILGNVLGTNAGYSIKQIGNISESSLAAVSGSGLSFKNKAGNFTADLVLGHLTKSDIVLSGATFEIGYVPVNLSFSPSKLSVKYGSPLTEPTLRGKYNGSGAGAVSYTSNNTAVATVDSGTGKVTVKSKGLVKITATQAKTLTHSAGVASYDLEVSDKTAVNLVFDRSILTVQLGSSSISEPTLRGQYNGSGAGAISYTSSNSTVAEVDSSGKLTVKALGTSVITVTQAATATHTGGSASYTLTVTKSDAPTDVKWKDAALSEVWSAGGSFSKAEILGNVAGTTTGYDLKTIANISNSEVAEVSGKAINFKNKAGNFTADLVLVHATQADIRLDNATFGIAKGAKETLTFNPLSEPYVANGNFSAVEILANIKADDKKVGYRVKEINTLDPVGIVTISADKRSLSFVTGKMGNFTATLVLEHDTKGDSEVTKAAFEVSASPPTDIGLSSKSIAEGKPIGSVVGTLSSTDTTVSDTHTYSFASGAGDDDNADFTIDGDKLKSNKVFDHTVKSNYKIRLRSTDGAGLYVEKAFSIDVIGFTFTQFSAVTTFPKTYTKGEIFAKVAGSKKGDYSIKSISILNGSSNCRCKRSGRSGHKGFRSI